MTFKELEEYFETLPDRVLDDASEIVSETAIEYFKESFTRKDWDGKPWVPPKKAKHIGSLMITSGALVNSITEKLRTRTRIIISAGNTKVTYAKAHNEGFNGWVSVPAHTRNGKAVKAHRKKMNLPARPYMGKSNALAKRIKERLQGHLNTIAKQIK